jgi:endonuclease/exonuclease/phosphatase family metal-dependent hydrolase
MAGRFVRLLALVAAVLAGGAARSQEPVRFASFNVALTEFEPGALVRRLEGGGDRQAQLVAETIQRVRPDVLALQEIDRDPERAALSIFLQDYLAVSQGGAEPIAFPHVLYPPSNTGVPTGVDLDGDGTVGGPGDARGYGKHPGQYALALLSRLPLGKARTFADVLWADVPESLMPEDYYSAKARGVLPLSSKTHVAVPVSAPWGEVWVLAAHPTPPVFDDARDWNGRRNADEIRMLAAMLDPAGKGWLVDDAGRPGGIPAGAEAVVLGDLNADPRRGDSRPGAIEQLLGAPRVVDPAPRSDRGDITAEFNGGMRVDYALPTTGLKVVGSGVFWPSTNGPLGRLNEASDHRLVWVDVQSPAAR